MLFSRTVKLEQVSKFPPSIFRSFSQEKSRGTVLVQNNSHFVVFAYLIDLKHMSSQLFSKKWNTEKAKIRPSVQILHTNMHLRVIMNAFVSDTGSKIDI